MQEETFQPGCAGGSGLALKVRPVIDATALVHLGDHISLPQLHVSVLPHGGPL